MSPRVTAIVEGAQSWGGLASGVLAVLAVLGFQLLTPDAQIQSLRAETAELRVRQAEIDTTLAEVRLYVAALARNACLDDPRNAARSGLRCRKLLNDEERSP